MNGQKISVIIPTYNEEAHISKTILWIQQSAGSMEVGEILVVDGGSQDETIATAKAAGARVIVSKQKGRAAQMNTGAQIATQEILYFLHADTIPPLHFANDILHAIQDGYKAGCYRLSFDHPHWFLKANCWFTRFNVGAFRYGDQSLFVTKEAFKKAGGYSESHVVMEDFDLIRRLRKEFPFSVLERPVLTSARKYLANGIYKTQAVFFLIFFMYQFGYSQQRLVATYRKHIRQDKI